MAEMPNNILPPEYEDFTSVIEQARGAFGPTAPITLFRDDYYFLSSMYPLKNGVETPDRKIVASVEIGYKADKHTFPARIAVLSCVDGYAANRRSKQLLEAGESTVEGWDENKVDVMRWYVYQKFGRNPDVSELLGETNNRLLIEGNNHGDDFWGVRKVRGGAWQGSNQLGKLLMETRTLLADGTNLLDAAEEVLEASPFLTDRRAGHVR